VQPHDGEVETGAARIIMDLSYPHDVRLGKGMACSPNMGMEAFEEFEPVSMTGDGNWRRCMHRAGRPAAFLKADWDMAYKHVSVRTEDHHLQVVEFCGRFFIEKCLTFGGGNSPTLYHLPASLLKTMAEVETGMDPRLNVMQLDDNCATYKLGSARPCMGLFTEGQQRRWGSGWLVKQIQRRLSRRVLGVKSLV
jgi:hypothetical protein